MEGSARFLPASPMSAESSVSANADTPAPSSAANATTDNAAEENALRPSATHHLVILGFCTAAILGAFLLGINKTDHLATPWLNIPLPSVCQFRNLTGLDCPGCGLSRAFVSIAHGRFAEAWSYNGASLLVFAFVLVQIPYRTFQVWRIRSGRGEIYWPLISNIIIAVVVGAMFLQWAVKIVSLWTS